MKNVKAKKERKNVNGHQGRRSHAPTSAQTENMHDKNDCLTPEKQNDTE